MKFFRRALTSLVLAAAVFASGCSSNPTHQLLYMVAVQQGTARFIEAKASDPERSKRATEIVRIAEILKATVGGEATTVAELRDKALALITAANLQPADHSLANTLVAVVAEVLQERITQGVLSPEDAVSVGVVLDNIIGTANVYVLQPEASAAAEILRDMIVARMVERVHEPA